MAGAWPKHPNLMPTLLLMSIAIIAAFFDLCVLGAYVFPSRAQALLRIAEKAHQLLSCIKGLSYAITAVVCRSGFVYGNDSGQNTDLWSWTCSDAADRFDSVTQAGANCDGQSCAWIIAIVQVCIEGLGLVGSMLIKDWARFQQGKLTAADLEADFQKVSSWSSELNDSLDGMTPKLDNKKQPSDA